MLKKFFCRGGEVAKLTWNILEAALKVAQEFSKDDVMFERCFEVVKIIYFDQIM